ncbi:MAG: L,D-transpeptidase family protein [Clostridiales bacterium]|nr:L,D-transpeptidase family protein [Clostridiales bacterium]
MKWNRIRTLQCVCILMAALFMGKANVAYATVINAQPGTTTTSTSEETVPNGTETGQGWDRTKTHYYDNGVKVTGFQSIDGILYYFDEKGELYKKIGLRTIEDEMYYFNKDHSIATGVVKVKDAYYYFEKETGICCEKTGIKKVDGKYYNFNDKSQLQSGWYRNSKGKRYYFDKTTFEAKVGWTYIGKYKYFFEKNGQLCQDLRKKMAKQIKKQKDDKDAYVIRVNRTASCVTVYAPDGENGYIIPVVSFVCSAGKETPTGSFIIRDKLRWHELMGPSWGQWCEHLTDDILFHSVYYNKERDNKSLSVKAYNKLGTMASHGCIRLTAGDSKWIYDNCAKGTKVIIYNNKKNPGPFDKPKAQKLSADHTWDPTDPGIRKK